MLRGELAGLGAGALEEVQGLMHSQQVDPGILKKDRISAVLTLLVRPSVPPANVSGRPSNYWPESPRIVHHSPCSKCGTSFKRLALITSDCAAQSVQQMWERPLNCWP